MDFLFKGNGDRGQVKRTKSFWKFGKSDAEDIVEGMAMWRHRDLIQPEHEMERFEEATETSTLKRNTNRKNSKSTKEERNKSQKSMERSGEKQPQSASRSRVKEMQQNITVPMVDDHSKYQLTKAEIDQRVGKAKERFQAEDPAPLIAKAVRDNETELDYVDEDDMLTIEDSLEEKPINGQRMRAYELDHTLTKNNNINSKNTYANNGRHTKYYDEMEMDERFYDDESMADEVMVMKTVKRKEILKQYYSSTSDTERHSSSSDPYDCIVVQDHHVMRNNKNNNVYQNNTNNNSMPNNRKNNKNKELTTFRSEFAMNQKNVDEGPPTMGTILPRTKLMKNGIPDKKIEKNGEMDSPQGKPTKKKQQNVDPSKVNGKRKNFEESSRNSLSSAKSYGPWYDLWGGSGGAPNANGMNNHTGTKNMISQK